MIIDKKQNLSLYSNLNPRFKIAIAYLEKTDFSRLAPGKHPVMGDEIFALVNHYETQQEEKCVLEAHEKYIDLQFMVSGREQIGYSPLVDQPPSKTYDSEHDYAL